MRAPGRAKSMNLLDVPSLRQLRAFEAAARLESVSGAAREVNLSQPGLTQSIHALEMRLNTRLFDRRRSGCYVTGPGAILLPRVQRFFDHVGAALSEPVIGSPFVGRQALAATVNKITGPQIRSLIAIAESPSMEAAARRLDISQPSLYRPARDLERELRRSLYHRTAQGVTTNAQGTELARRFQVALREIEYGLEELYAAQGSVVSRIAVGNIPHSGERVLSAAVDALLASYPTVRVQVVEGHYDVLLDDLRAGKLDLLFGVLRRPTWAVDVTEELLFENPYVVVARDGHPLSDAKRVTLRDLARYDWIMPEAGAPRRQAFERMFAALPRLPAVSIETTSLPIYRSILATSDRLTLMSRLAARSAESAALTVLPFRSPHLRRTDGVASRIDWHPTNIHLRFLQLLRAEARRLARGRAGTAAGGSRYDAAAQVVD
jgi:LysR family transcriptional regulator, regulator for genes of the gallate degradation pathway